MIQATRSLSMNITWNVLIIFHSESSRQRTPFLLTFCVRSSPQPSCIIDSKLRTIKTGTGSRGRQIQGPDNQALYWMDHWVLRLMPLRLHSKLRHRVRHMSQTPQNRSNLQFCKETFNMVFGLTGYILWRDAWSTTKFYHRFYNQNGNDTKAVKRFQVITKRR